jgi:toluene monooxygenase system protein E
MALSSQPQRARRKTWTLFEERRKPSEYEVVSHRMNYHFRRGDSPFELDPDYVMNRWYREKLEGSPFMVDDWDGFRDPARLTYRAYVALQRERESYLDNLTDEFERRDHYAQLDEGWVDTLDSLYLTSRFAGHVLQLGSVYVSQMAPSSYITIAYHFEGGDEMRRVQRTAYLAKALSLDHDERLADTAHARRIWEEDSHWQPMRELLEKMLIAYDWGEAFAAVALVAKPAFDALMNEQLSALARANGDEMLALVADDFQLDDRRHKATARALVDYSLHQKPELADVLGEWVQKWTPLADAAVEGLSGLWEGAPTPIPAETVREAAGERRSALLAECGLA